MLLLRGLRGRPIPIQMQMQMQMRMHSPKMSMRNDGSLTPLQHLHQHLILSLSRNTAVHRSFASVASYSEQQQQQPTTPAAFSARLEACVSAEDNLLDAAERANELLNAMYAKATQDNNLLLLPTLGHYQMVLTAWSRVAHIKGVPQRAQQVLESMEARATTTTTGKSTSIARPSVELYNLVLRIWAHSTEHSRATFASHLLDRMGPRLTPNAETHRMILLAWCLSGQRGAAMTAKRHLTTMTDLLTKEGRFDMEPSLSDYQHLLQTMSTSKETGASTYAHEVFELMEFLFANRYTQVRPDLKCYRCILQTFANSTKHNLGPKADKLLNLMTSRYVSPDAECYAAAIHIWSNEAIHPQSQDRFKAASRAHNVLQEMNRAHHRSANEDIVLKTHHYNLVLKAWATTSRAVLPVANAEALLAGMEASTDAPPNAESYSLVLLTYSMSKDKNALEKAKLLLERAKQSLSPMEPSLYSSFIRVCAKQRKDMLPAFSLAVEAFQEARKSNLVNSDSLHSLLTAGNNLLSVGDARNRALERIFEQGCQLGLLNRELLQFFRHISTPAVYDHLVVSAQQDKQLPLSWFCESRPLTADGDYLWTKPMMEHRMRHSKQHVGRRIMQGGRVVMTEDATSKDA